MPYYYVQQLIFHYISDYQCFGSVSTQTQLISHRSASVPRAWDGAHNEHHRQMRSHITALGIDFTPGAVITIHSHLQVL